MWEESKHPRDDDGKFTSKNGTPAEHKRLRELGIINKDEEKRLNNKVKSKSIKPEKGYTITATKAEMKKYTSDYEKQVDLVISGKYNSSNMLKVTSKTPKILQDIGLPNLPILISQKIIEKIVNIHNLSVEQVKELPRFMGEPFLILESVTEPDSVVEYIRDVDKNGNPIMVAICVNKPSRFNNKYIKAHSIKSEYGKDNLKTQIRKAIEQNKILYFNKKRFDHLPVNPGLQLSSIIEDLKPYNNIIHKIK